MDKKATDKVKAKPCRTKTIVLTIVGTTPLIAPRWSGCILRRD